MNPKRSFFLLILIFSFFLVSQITNGQTKSTNTSFRFETFELPLGTLSNSVQSIAQDSFGFMWFGSKNGLHRWDGYQFKTYLHDPEDSTSIASNYIEFIYVAKDGSLWLGKGNGIDHFDPEAEIFHHYVPKSSIKRNIGVSGIIEDSSGNIWIGSHYGVYQVDVKSRAFKQYLHDPDKPNSLSHNICRSLYMDAEGTLWFGTGLFWGQSSEGGLNRFRPEKEDFVRYFHDPNDTSSLSSNIVTEIFEDSRGDFWIGTLGEGLHLMDRKKGTFERIKNISEKSDQMGGPIPEINSDPHVRCIVEDQKNKLWIGTWNGGVKYYDPEADYSQVYYHDANNPESLPENYLWTIFQSHDGTLWGATTGPGSTVFKIVESSFGYFPVPYDRNTVYSFCETRGEKLWVGTSHSGLLKFDLKNNEWSKFDTERLHSAITNLDAINFDRKLLDKDQILKGITKIVEDAEEGLWMKKESIPGLIHVRPKEGDLKIFLHDPNDDNSIGKGLVTDIFKDGDDQIWIVTANGDLNLFDAITERFIKFKYPTVQNKKSTFAYTCRLAPAKDGKIWITGSGKAPNPLPIFLAKFDPKTKEFISVIINLSASEQYYNNQEIHNIEEDRSGNIWICNATHLMKVVPNTGYRTASHAFQYGSANFSAMVLDSQYRVWLFGENVSFFDPLSGNSSIRNITSSNIKILPIHKQSIFKDSRGLIYFGGQGGFHSFSPAKTVKTNGAALPETIITNFHLPNELDGEKNKSMPENILSTADIFLDYNQNAFSIRFAALAFRNPQSNRHEFKLEGYDEQWRPAGLEPIANYVKVPPGNYIFRARGASEGGEWGMESSLGILISPPIWATWWAYTLYALLGLGSLYAFYRFQLNRKLEKAEALRLKETQRLKAFIEGEEKERKRVARELHDGLGAVLATVKMQISSIQHKFPKIESSETYQKATSLIDDSCRTVREIAHGMMPQVLEQQGLEIAIEDLCQTLASHNEIIFDFNYFGDEESLSSTLKTSIYRITQELLKNIIKHAHAKEVIVQLTIEEDEIMLIVEDDGKGFDISTSHNGIGIANISSRTDYLNGTLEIDSTAEQGSTFTILLPKN